MSIKPTEYIDRIIEMKASKLPKPTKLPNTNVAIPIPIRLSPDVLTIKTKTSRVKDGNLVIKFWDSDQNRWYRKTLYNSDGVNLCHYYAPYRIALEPLLWALEIVTSRWKNHNNVKITTLYPETMAKMFEVHRGKTSRLGTLISQVPADTQFNFESSEDLEVKKHSPTFDIHIDFRTPAVLFEALDSDPVGYIGFHIEDVSLSTDDSSSSSSSTNRRRRHQSEEPVIDDVFGDKKNISKNQMMLLAMEKALHSFSPLDDNVFRIISTDAQFVSWFNNDSMLRDITDNDGHDFLVGHDIHVLLGTSPHEKLSEKLDDIIYETFTKVLILPPIISLFKKEPIPLIFEDDDHDCDIYKVRKQFKDVPDEDGALLDQTYKSTFRFKRGADTIFYDFTIVRQCIRD
jgi:hypothetical protein